MFASFWEAHLQNKKKWCTEKVSFGDSQNNKRIYFGRLLLSFSCLFRFELHIALEAILQMVTEELMQRLCTTAQRREGETKRRRRRRRRGMDGGGRRDKLSQFMPTLHMCSVPGGGEAQRPTPSLPWPALTLGPKCDTSSLRWESMSSVQWNTPGANKDVSALKQNW